MSPLRFEVTGQIAGKGSVTRLPNGGMVHAGTKGGRERLVSWETAVKDAANQAVAGMGWAQLTGPVAVAIDLAFPRGGSHRFDTRHVTPIDADKAARLVLDCLQQVGVFRNDSQVCLLTVSKRYTTDGRSGALICVYDQAADEADDRARLKACAAEERRQARAAS